MTVIDKKRTDGILYPPLQDAEEKLEGCHNEFIHLHHEEYRTFPLDFRLKNIVIDSIAKKYNEEISDYPEIDDDSERFLIGPKAFRMFVHDLSCPCPYMQKALTVLEENFPGIKPIAIHLLNKDEGTVNRQMFIAFSREGIYLRYATNDVEKYKYENLRITPDGVEDINRVSGDLLLEYPLAEAFRHFVQEFLLLRRSTLLPIEVRHPLADMPSEMRERYLAFLVDAAAAEGQLGVHGLIYLEYLARSFYVSANKLAQWLEEAYGGGMKDSDLHKRLTDFLAIRSPIPTDKYHVLCMDILELIEGRDGKIHRPKLLALLKRKGDVFGQGFIEYFSSAVELRAQTEELMYKMHLAVEKIPHNRFELYRENMITWQRYRNDLTLKLLDIGVMINEY